MFNPQVIDRPHLFPQRCLTCLGASDREVVDTGVQLPEDLGRLYICLSCLKDIATSAGYATLEDIAEATAANAALQAKVSAIEAVAEGMKNDIRNAHDRALAGLDDAVASVGPAPAPTARGKREPRIPSFSPGDFDTAGLQELD